MKYMGSKRTLMANGLGDVVRSEAADSERFVDLFSGTGCVSWYVAEAFDIPVLAVDLQHYAFVLAAAVIERDRPMHSRMLLDRWLDESEESVCDNYLVAPYRGWIPDRLSVVREARELCASNPGGPIWTAYGGHYFSPRQAAVFDTLIENMPRGDRGLTLFCRALVILAASSCAASPGHTAQPFGPTESALPHIVDSWKRDPIGRIRTILPDLARRHAFRKGRAMVADANQVIKQLGPGDVAFVDPPYSSVHYSRFYHVLETLARGSCGPVTGVGRYPPRSERPRSAYSIKSQALPAMLRLLEGLAANRSRVILTFPSETSSNGMNGRDLVKYARRWYRVRAQVVTSRLSTMGGNGYNRLARHAVGEMIAVMHPR